MRVDLRNPVVWLREGVSAILLVPVLMLHWLGLASDARAADSVSRSAVSRILSGIVTLVGLVASVMGILLGWSDILNLVRQLF